MSSNPGSGGTYTNNTQCNCNSTTTLPAATHHVIERQGVVLYTLMTHTSPYCLPHHQSEAVDINSSEVLEDRHIHGHVQDLWRHISLGADPGVLRDVGLARGLSVGDSQSKVSDDTVAISSDQDVLCLDVSVCNGWLTLL